MVFARTFVTGKPPNLSKSTANHDDAPASILPRHGSDDNDERQAPVAPWAARTTIAEALATTLISRPGD